MNVDEIQEQINLCRPAIAKLADSKIPDPAMAAGMFAVMQQSALLEIALQLCRCADTLGEIKYHMEKLRSGK